MISGKKREGFVETRRRRPTAEKPKKEDLIRILNEHRGVQNTSKHLGCSPCTMRGWMSEYGLIVPRGRSRASETNLVTDLGHLVETRSWTDLVYHAWERGFASMREQAVAAGFTGVDFERTYLYLIGRAPVGALRADEYFDGGEAP